jgi:hypothetical protein
MSLIRSFLTYHHASCQQSKYNTPNEKHSPNEFHNPICINIKERFIMHAKMRCIITQLDTFFPCWEKLFPQQSRGTQPVGSYRAQWLRRSKRRKHQISFQPPYRSIQSLSRIIQCCHKNKNCSYYNKNPQIKIVLINPPLLSHQHHAVRKYRREHP